MIKYLHIVWQFIHAIDIPPENCVETTNIQVDNMGEYRYIEDDPWGKKSFAGGENNLTTKDKIVTFYFTTTKSEKDDHKTTTV